MEKTLKLSAVRVANQLNIQGIKKSLEIKPLADNSSELLYSIAPDKYLCYLNYGIIVFCGYSEEEIEVTVRDIQPPLQNPETWQRDTYSLKVVAGAELKLELAALTVDRLDNAVARIIMLNTAQSLALNYYNNILDDLIKEIKQLTTHLESTGKLRLSRKNMLKFIGRGLNIKNDIADNIYIFNSPGAGLGREDGNLLYNSLAKQFDLTIRSSKVDHTLKIIQSNLDVLTEISNQTESNRLERIIIVLILIEVFDLFLTKLF